MRSPSAPLSIAAAAIFLALATASMVHAQEASPALIAAPAQAQPILPIRQVRIGQRGYGLTVFHGTRIEPFPVEVVSVMSDFEPKRGVVWIRCNDERLAVSGPVQGMSGSPIYLWDDGETQEPGKGGRLIGAFAYGFSLSKICLAGVQPIEQMRAVAGRAEPGRAGQAAMGGPHAGQTLALLQHSAGQRRMAGLPMAQLALMAQLCAHLPGYEARDQWPMTLPASPTGEGRVMPMLLPMSVGMPELLSLWRPLLEPMGIAAMASPMATVAGPPPLGLDAGSARLEPGSVLSVPLGFGDMDLAAAGTVTDVLPDGRVLGFGHAMFGQGDTAVPMATGYVHTIVPLLTTSFKLSGSLNMAGALVRDENSAVVGTADGAFVTAPVKVRVNVAGQLQREYNYRIVNHRMFTPVLAAIVTVQSLMAEQQLPPEHTLRLSGHVAFAGGDGGRRVQLHAVTAGSGMDAIVYQLIPPLAAMMQNPFERVELGEIELTIDVEPTLRAMTLIEGRVDRVEVAPGDTLGVNLRLQPYGAEATSRRIEFTIPADLKDGDYELVVCDGTSYMQRTVASRPHRMSVRNVDELRQSIQDILSVDAMAIYALLQLPDQGLAYGRHELPRLPSSRRVMVQTPTTTGVTPYAQWMEVKTPVEAVTSGELSFTLNVRRPFKSR